MGFFALYSKILCMQWPLINWDTMIFPVNDTTVLRWLGHFADTMSLLSRKSRGELELHAQAASALYLQGALSRPRIVDQTGSVSMITGTRVPNDV
jgi:hypothetical protein